MRSERNKRKYSAVAATTGTSGAILYQRLGSVGVAQLPKGSSPVNRVPLLVSDLLMSHCRNGQAGVIHKLDRHKIRSRFPKEHYELEDNYKSNYYRLIIKFITHIPEAAAATQCFNAWHLAVVRAGT